MKIRNYLAAFCCRALAIALLCGVFSSACKKADTSAAENNWLSASDFARKNPPVLCLERLETLVQENKGGFWGTLKKSQGVSLCQQSTSTSAVDCLVNSAERAKNEVSAKALTELDFAPLVASCIKTEQARVPPKDVSPAIQEQTDSLCLKELKKAETQLEDLGHLYNDEDDMRLRNLCAGSDVSTRVLRCLTGVPANLSRASYGDFVMLCKGNKNPLASACFKEALSKFLVDAKFWELSVSEAAFLCGAGSK